MTPGEEFVFIVMEFQQYYNETCMICKRHYYYCTLRKAPVLNTIVGHTNRDLGGTVSMVWAEASTATPTIIVHTIDYY